LHDCAFRGEAAEAGSTAETASARAMAAAPVSANVIVRINVLLGCFGYPNLNVVIKQSFENFRLTLSGSRSRSRDVS
jgi:hypothetical protein